LAARERDEIPAVSVSIDRYAVTEATTSAVSARTRRMVTLT